MSVVNEILERVSWMQWDEKLALFRAMCDYVGEIEALNYILRNSQDAVSFRTTLETLHWDQAWASFERAHLARLLKYLNVDCVFDVGANAGQYAERLRQEIGFTGYIISFEPIPELAAALRHKAEVDGKWYIREVALDRAPGDARFNIMASKVFSSLLDPTAEEIDKLTEFNTVTRSITVQKATLDEEVRRCAFLGVSRLFLKLDTQGNDLNVVAGGAETIGSFVGLQSELSFKRLYRGAPLYQEALETFRKLGFELSALVPNTGSHFPTLIEMDCLMFRSRIGQHPSDKL
jgi:FkbM family methyltransferase